MEVEIIKPGYHRVSKILSPMLDFDNVDPYIRENAKNRGTLIHAAIDGFNKGIPVPLGLHEGYFNSILKWVTYMGLDFGETETRLYDEKLKITGKIDAFMFSKKNGSMIVDWKVVSSLPKEYCELQGMFYHYLAKSNGMALSEVFYFVVPDSNGALPQVYKFHTSQFLWNKCLEKYYAHLSI